MSSNEPTDLKDLKQDELTTAHSPEKDVLNDVPQEKSSEHWDEEKSVVWTQKYKTLSIIVGFIFSPISIYLLWRYHPAKGFAGVVIKTFLSLVSIFLNVLGISSIMSLLFGL